MITCRDRASENCGFDPQKIADLRPDPRILVAGPLGELHGAFTDKDGVDVIVTFQNESPTVWETETLCTRVVKIHDQNKKITLPLSLQTTDKLQFR